jgi:CRISPR-associated protein Cas5d
MTPSAAVGILCSVFAKPEMRWVIERIEVLAPVQFMSIKMNGVKNVATIDAAAMRADVLPFINITSDRVRIQQAHRVLTNVDYVVQAHMMPGINPSGFDRLKYESMFERRVTKGQEYRAPCLGCQQYPVEELDWADHDTPPPIPVTRPLGPMIYSVWNDQREFAPVFFWADLDNGVMEVPQTPPYCAPPMRPKGRAKGAQS